ncbi:MAG: hypothetical protein NXH85_04410 [Pseudomonadaceae bacterium]|nr:hypothetical protein [Pseudomonadaceae bacterium]
MNKTSGAIASAQLDDISPRERLLSMPKTPLSITIDKGAMTQARLRLILAVGAGTTLVCWAGYFTSGGEALFEALGVPADFILALFVTGFVATFAFAMMSVVMAISSRWHRADIQAIESGFYLWHKRLSREAAASVGNAATKAYAEKQSMMLKVLAGVGGVTAVLSSLGGIGEPNFGEYFVTVTLIVIALFAAMAGFFWLVFWISRPTQFLMNGLDQIVFTEDGLVVEPIYWPWDTTGFALEDLKLQTQAPPTLELVFVNHVKSQAQRHELSIPLDDSDIEDVKTLVQLLGNYRARAALKIELQRRQNPTDSAHAF